MFFLIFHQNFRALKITGTKCQNLYDYVYNRNYISWAIKVYTGNLLEKRQSEDFCHSRRIAVN